MQGYHTYVLSENQEIVKIVGERYEYTGMYILE